MKINAHPFPGTPAFEKFVEAKLAEEERQLQSPTSSKRAMWRETLKKKNQNQGPP